MEVNEEIIEQYLKLKRFFYIHDIKFKVWGDKGGSNYSNIDFLAISPNGDFYDIEVKFRSKYKLTVGSKASEKWIQNLAEQITRKERIEEIKKYSNKKPKKIIISTHVCFGKKSEKRKVIEEKLRSKVKGYDLEFWYFEDIIPFLRKETGPHGRYDSPILQMIRLLDKDNKENHSQDGN